MLARFAVVGALVTVVDVGLFLALWSGGDRNPALADMAALALASVVSFLAHRAVTFRGDPYRRWLDHHGAFAVAAVGGGAVDLTLVVVVLAATDTSAPATAAGAKLGAVAVAGLARWVLHRRVLFRIVRDGQIARPGRPPAPGDVRVSVLLPAYGEAEGIGDSVRRVRAALADFAGGNEIVVVDDGSPDATAARARGAGADVVVALAENRGKGAAVRAGAEVAHGRTIVFTDADLAYDPTQLVTVVEEVERGWDLVVGSRRLAGTVTAVRARRVREVGGWVINRLTHAVVLGQYRDTQCGLKAFRSDVAGALFPRCRIDGFAFDIEVFVIAERDRLALQEVPVRVANSRASTVHAARDGTRLVRDLFRIRRWARQGLYQREPDPSARPCTSVPAGMGDPGAVFKAYDIRGTVPDQLDAELVEAVGAAFARFARKDSGAVTRVLIGRDMRPSGVELGAAFAAGVQAQGIDVVDLGLASTDLVYFAAGSLDAPGAMLTASHNPAGYNGIKLCLSGARPVGEDSGLAEIQAAVEAGIRAAPAEPGRIDQLDLLGAFADHVRSFVDRSVLRPLKVVADTANGMGGLVVPAVFEGLPFELEVLYGELDGTFPNHPADPIQPENQRDLQARVLETGADVGLAFDGDADRVFLVDEAGRLLSGSLTTALVASGILARQPAGTKVIHNLICSKAVPEAIREAGGEPVRSRVGHSFIKALMAETGAVFAGEHSGHYYFRDNYRADSGLIAALVVLEQLSVAGIPLSELRRPLERYAASGELNTRVADPQATIERVAAAFAEHPQDRLDGLTVDGGDWWFNLRPSNTEPLLRLNLEAPTDDDVTSRVAEVRSLMQD